MSHGSRNYEAEYIDNLDGRGTALLSSAAGRKLDTSIAKGSRAAASGSGGGIGTSGVGNFQHKITTMDTELAVLSQRPAHRTAQPPGSTAAPAAAAGKVASGRETWGGMDLCEDDVSTMRSLVASGLQELLLLRAEEEDSGEEEERQRAEGGGRRAQQGHKVAAAGGGGDAVDAALTLTPQGGAKANRYGRCGEGQGIQVNE